MKSPFLFQWLYHPPCGLDLLLLLYRLCRLEQGLTEQVVVQVLIPTIVQWLVKETADWGVGCQYAFRFRKIDTQISDKRCNSIFYMLNLTCSRVMICKSFFFLNPLFFAFSVFWLVIIWYCNNFDIKLFCVIFSVILYSDLGNHFHAFENKEALCYSCKCEAWETKHKINKNRHGSSHVIAWAALPYLLI